MRRFRLSKIALLLMIAAACYSTYTGIYWISRAEVPGTADFGDLEQEIYDSVKDLGFEPRKDDARTLIKRPDSLARTGQRWDGDESFITIAIRKSGPSITLRDHSNRSETEYTRELKERIERRLRIRYGVRGLQFQRQSEFPPFG